MFERLAPPIPDQPSTPETSGVEAEQAGLMGKGSLVPPVETDAGRLERLAKMFDDINHRESRADLVLITFQAAKDEKTPVKK